MPKNNLGLSEEDIEALRNAASPTAEILNAIHELSDKFDIDKLQTAKAEKRRFVINCVLNIVFGLAGVAAAVFAALTYFA